MFLYTSFKQGFPPIINDSETRMLRNDEHVSKEHRECLGVTLNKHFIYKKLDIFDLTPMFANGRIIVCAKENI